MCWYTADFRWTGTLWLPLDSPGLPVPSVGRELLDWHECEDNSSQGCRSEFSWNRYTCLWSDRVSRHVLAMRLFRVVRQRVSGPGQLYECCHVECLSWLHIALARDDCGRTGCDLCHSIARDFTGQNPYSWCSGCWLYHAFAPPCVEHTHGRGARRRLPPGLTPRAWRWTLRCLCTVVAAHSSRRGCSCGGLGSVCKPIKYPHTGAGSG